MQLDYSHSLKIPNTNNLSKWNNELYKYLVNALYYCYKYKTNNLNTPKGLFIDELIYDKYGDALAMIFSYNDIVFVIIRGTVTHYERSEDMDARQKRVIIQSDPTQEVEIHEGFLEIYETYVQKKLLNTVEKLKPKQIIVAGHSLGAAIGTIAAIELQSISKDIVLYTVGSPRVGSPGLSEAYEKLEIPYFRVVNNADIIPDSIPPVYLGEDSDNIVKYKHCGTPVTYYQNWLSYYNNHSLSNYIQFTKIIVYK